MCPIDIRKRRHRFQFSLRALAAFVLVCSLALSWVAVKIREADRQRKIVARIVANGGWVNYDYNVIAWSAAGPTEGPGRPALLKRLIGDDFCAKVIAATVCDSQGMRSISDLPQLDYLRVEGPVSDASLSHLARARSPLVLDLRFSEVTDNGMQYLSGFTRLQALHLEERPITGAGLAKIRHLKSLENLHLRGTLITDADLKIVAGFSNLRLLSLSHTGITHRGIRHLRPLSRLEALFLTGIDLTDASLRDIGTLLNLEFLGIQGNSISDVGMCHLRQLTKMRYLGISDASVTDAGLVHLKGMTQLESLSLYDTQLTAKAAEYLPDTLSKLHTLEVSGPFVTDAEAEELYARFPNLDSIFTGNGERGVSSLWCVSRTLRDNKTAPGATAGLPNSAESR